MLTSQVLIAGGGPTGLMLAGELRLAGIDVLVLERRAAGIQESRAGGIHARTMEIFDQRGFLDRMLPEARKMNVAHFSALWLDVSALPTRYPFLASILQHRIERHLADWADGLGVRVLRDTEVVGLRQDDDGVEVELRGAATAARGAYLVGRDGGRSTVRKLAGIDFPGTPATMTALLADVELTDPPARTFQERREHGSFSVIDFEPGWYRVMTNEYDRVVDREAGVGLDDVRAAMRRIAGTDFGMHSPRWVSRFSDAARQAAEYRRGRVLLAGDAAHIHFPAGGQGLNTGVQDAVNLGWKLAAVLHGASDELLDTYHAERHPVGARVLHNTRAQTILGAPGEHMTALRETMAELIGLEEVNARLAGMITALDVRYETGGHPLVGVRVPDVDIKASGVSRVHELLRPGRPVLLDLGADVDLREVAAGWADRVDVVDAVAGDEAWRLPPSGEVAAPRALLIRPDGHVAWVADEEADVEGLRSALGRWFGPGR